MKKSIITLLVITGGYLQAQVSIGKETSTNSSVSLEFGETENRGLILSYVEDKSSISEEGTIVYDITDHKVKYLKDGGTWINLSEDESTTVTMGDVDLSIQMGKTEQATAKMAIGVNAETDTISGILVLTDTDKAMVLPKVASPHLNIMDPAAGMMVYDTEAKQLAVYNGKVWSFWKP